MTRNPRNPRINMNTTPRTTHRQLLLTAGLVTGILAPLGQAASIAYNFSETDTNNSQELDTTTPKGPLGTSVWNDSYVRDSGTVATGSDSGLVDDSGAATTASIAWSSKETWFGDGGTTTQDERIVLGYLDDGDDGLGNPGLFMTISNIPYASYNVYGIVGSDSGDSTTYTVQDFLVNGTTWVFGGSSPVTATAFANMAASSANGSWTEIIAGGQTGNYWKLEGLSGSTLTIDGQTSDAGARGSLAGVIIEQVPEPSSAALLLGTTVLLVGRRRRTPPAGR